MTDSYRKDIAARGAARFESIGAQELEQAEHLASYQDSSLAFPHLFRRLLDERSRLLAELETARNYADLLTRNLLSPVGNEQIAAMNAIEDWLRTSDLYLAKMSQEQGNAEPPAGWIVQLERDALCGETDVLATARGRTLSEAILAATKEARPCATE